MPDHVSNHLAARCYLGGFTDPDGWLMVRGRYGSNSRRARPKSVGFRNYFWGHDDLLRSTIEQRFGIAESNAAPALARIRQVGLPPVGSPQRGALVEFIAIHAVRTPAWRNLIFEVRDRLLREQGHDKPGFEHIADWVRSDDFWIAATARQVPAIGTVLASAYWDLVRFTSPWLLTCDQPLVQFPFLRANERRLAVEARATLLETLEFRFVVDPWHAIVISWIDQVEELQPVNGNLRMAADLNRSVGVRTDQEFFFLPGADPPLAAPPWNARDSVPLAGLIHEGYGTGEATESQRRHRAAGLLFESIDQDVTDQIRYVRLG